MFGRSEHITQKDKEKVEILNKENKFIYLQPRVSQEQLVKELRQSDVWLYPTCFEETYCISAVEAMASECLVVTFAYAALNEIVKDRGVVVELTSENMEIANSQLFDKMCNVLDNPSEKMDIIDRGYNWAMKQDFYSLALEWKNNLFTS